MNLNRWLFASVFPLLLLTLCGCDVHKKFAEFDFGQGMKKYYAGDMAGASNDFSAAIAQNTNYVDAYVYRGTINLNFHNFTLALQDFDRALALSPREASLVVDRAAALYGLEKYSEAISNCTEAIKLDPEQDYAYKYRAISRGMLRDLDGALEDFNEIEKLKANDPWVYMSRANLHQERREYESAESDATKAIEMEATNPEPYRIRGYARTRLKDYDNALADLNEANHLQLNDPETLAGRGFVKMEQGDLKGAGEDVAEALKCSPTNLTAMIELASIKVKSGDLEGAAAVLKKTAATAPKFRMPEILEFLATVQRDLTEFAPSLENLRQVVDQAPKKYYAHFGIWILRARAGERDEATKALRASVKSWEGDQGQEWTRCIGHFLAGDVTESNLLAQATETAARKTDEPSQKCEALYYAGIKRLMDGDKTGATDLLQKCVALDQKNDEQYFGAKAELLRMKKTQ